MIKVFSPVFNLVNVVSSDVSTDDPECTAVMKKIKKIIGAPKNYGLSLEEQEEENRRREDKRRQKVAAEAVQRKHRKAAALVEMAAQYEEWVSTDITGSHHLRIKQRKTQAKLFLQQRNLLEVRRQEGELLEAQALPLRNYLMKHVMPSLTQAMLECSRIKPDDPVDFLVFTQ